MTNPERITFKKPNVISSKNEAGIGVGSVKVAKTPEFKAKENTEPAARLVFKGADYKAANDDNWTKSPAAIGDPEVLKQSIVLEGNKSDGGMDSKDSDFSGWKTNGAREPVLKKAA